MEAITMIETNNDFTLGGVTSNICMKYHENGSTTAVLGIIRHRNTRGRSSPPACGNGYNTAELAFAKGHIIGLEIGGVDDGYNVVPQFEHWQGKPNGEWRQMEIELSQVQFNNAMILIEVNWGRTGIEEAHDVALALFQENHIRDWTDRRIPDAYRIRVWNGGGDPSSITSDADFDTAVTSINPATVIYDKQIVLGDAMPEPDRAMYIEQHALGVALERHVALKREDSMMSFLMDVGTVDMVRADVAKNKSILSTEAAGIQAVPIMQAYQNISLPRIKAKMKDRTKRKLGVDSDDKIGLTRAGVQKAKRKKPMTA